MHTILGVAIMSVATLRFTIKLYWLYVYTNRPKYRKISFVWKRISIRDSKKYRIYWAHERTVL